jgi:hypothetical protein
MKNYSKKDVKMVKFILENCETVWIPQECLINFEANYTKDGYELDAHIIDNCKLDGYLFDTKSPLQRLNHRSDICSVELELVNGEEIELALVWNPEGYSDNNFQTSELLSYKELKISINKYNKMFSIQDILKLEDGTVVMDQYGKEYRVEEDEDGKYLYDTFVTDYILCSKFKIKNIG